MPQSTPNPHRLDPYKNFKFKIVWEDRVVAGVSKMSGLKRDAKTPEGTKFEAITLERGVTHDMEFERWASMVWSPSEKESFLQDQRKNITIQIYNEAGKLTGTCNVFNCWVSEYQAMPDLDANVTGIKSIKLENEGWERG
ncbi:MAG: phage tail protein [Chloroflexota bacterium]